MPIAVFSAKANLLNPNVLVVAAGFSNGLCHAGSKAEMTETTNPQKPSRLPDTSSQVVRQRWLELLDLSYSSRRVTGQEIEPGVYAVVVPMPCRKEMDNNVLAADARMAAGRVPGMARGVRFALERVGEFDLTLPADYRGWMAAWGKDIAAGETQVSVFVDLAYLEAALLARLWDHEVIVEFGSPLAFFRRGALTDYANVYAAVVAMVVEGSSLADTADQLAGQILSRLQLYANVYLQLSSLYVQASWQIDRDNFVIKIPDSRLSLILQYWQLRTDSKSPEQTVNEWNHRIEELLKQSILSSQDNGFPKSFVA
jgi:hypothetical protein